MRIQLQSIILPCSADGECRVTQAADYRKDRYKRLLWNTATTENSAIRFWLPKIEDLRIKY
ncbi:MAG: hypothetical protein DWI22_12740 [Planctomycetota bacterium]|nr:MAG: hypothetical protein DWI22_12740 [Planctomycetota bacterium]